MDTDTSTDRPTADASRTATPGASRTSTSRTSTSGTSTPGTSTSRASGASPVRTAAGSRRFPGPRAVLREPFRARTWRRVAYLLLALPLALLCVPLALVGGPVGRIQFWLMRRVLGVEPGTVARESGGVLGVAHALVALPLALVSAVVVLYFWFVVVINLGYPLRPDNDPTGSWGGPTMAGAWAVHAVGGGVTFLLLTPWVAKGFSALQVRLATGLLGRSRAGLGRTVALALGVAALCGLLSVPIIHQL
ncbi:sensor domain-containing protein [Streptomyces sp. NPDC004111]|uniref:sensor domain-containing protein n=1 Tax=Streptomyces sp. NPDC004111 TaxID=3364690 RepID=UPI0036B95C30